MSRYVHIFDLGMSSRTKARKSETSPTTHARHAPEKRKETMMKKITSQLPAAAVGALLMFAFLHLFNLSSKKGDTSELANAIRGGINVVNANKGAVSAAWQHEKIKFDWQCTSTSDMRQLINATDNIIVVMPAKAAGTSLKHFASRCYGDGYSPVFNNIQDKLEGEGIEAVLSNAWDSPGVIASHFWHPQALSRILQNASPRTLIIYSHRDENSRFKSAAYHVLSQWCKNGIPQQLVKVMPALKGIFDGQKDKCNINEMDLIKTLRLRPQEMQMGTNELLTCELYSAIEEYAPNMIFMDFKSASDMQNLMAEKYCPKIVDHPTAIGKKGVSVVLMFMKDITVHLSLTPTYVLFLPCNRI